MCGRFCHSMKVNPGFLSLSQLTFFTTNDQRNLYGKTANLFSSVQHTRFHDPIKDRHKCSFFLDFNMLHCILQFVTVLAVHQHEIFINLSCGDSRFVTYFIGCLRTYITSHFNRMFCYCFCHFLHGFASITKLRAPSPSSNCFTPFSLSLLCFLSIH